MEKGAEWSVDLLSLRTRRQSKEWLAPMFSFLTEEQGDRACRQDALFLERKTRDDKHQERRKNITSRGNSKENEQVQRGQEDGPNECQASELF